MSNLSQPQKVVEFLKASPNQKFNARQIAEQTVVKYPEDYSEKRQNPRFADEKAFISQIVAEIGAQKKQIVRNDNHVFWQDKPRPRVYWYDPEKVAGEPIESVLDEDEDVEVVTTSTISDTLSENDLYPILIEYLKSELELYCQRIDEKRSKNSRGPGGNKWLHPDIVAIQPVDIEWNDFTCQTQTRS